MKPNDKVLVTWNGIYLYLDSSPTKTSQVNNKYFNTIATLKEYNKDFIKVTLFDGESCILGPNEFSEIPEELQNESLETIKLYLAL